MNFKSILLAAAVGLTTFGVMPEAKAAECSTTSSYRICYDFISRSGQYNTWDVSLTNRHTTEFMRVTCYGNSVDDWSSRGGASQAEAQRLAEAFCAL